MRLTRFQLFLLGGLFLMVMGPLAFTQPGGGKGDRKGGPGGFKMTADGPFTMLSGGNDFIDIKTVQIPGWMTRGASADAVKEKMLAFAQKKGITDGKMTKAVYAEYFEEGMAEMRAKMADTGKQDGGTAAAPGTPPAPPQDVEADARDAFTLMDTDKNGSLSVEELKANGKRGQRLLDDLAKWDTNKNGTIELPEYVEYFKDRIAQRGNGGRGGQNPPPVEPVKPIEEDKRPTVYRTGKMPKELPPWFEEADKDKDGQVGLYEWKATGKSVREFMAMDQNGDGFITVEEVLRHQRATAKATDSPSSGSPAVTGSSATPATDDATRGRGKGGPGRGKGGRGKGG